MNPAEKIIARFGGLSDMSRKLKEALGKPVPVSTIQYWAAQGYIPSKRVPDIVAAGKFHDIPVTHGECVGESEAA